MTFASQPVPDSAGDGATRESPALSPLDEREQLRQAAAPAPGRYLAVPEGDGARLVSLPEPVARIGRSLSADVPLEHSSVSRRHAMVVRRGDQSVLLDDRSTNGVYVNGE